jgi:hypothetical protein
LDQYKNQFLTVEKMKKLIMKNATVKFMLVLALVFSFTACDEQFEEMNTDPNRIAEIEPAFLFTNAVRATFRNAIGSLHYKFGASYAHMFVPIKNDRQSDEYKTIYAQDWYNDVFGGIYGGPIRHINEALRLTAEGEYENEVQYAIADIIAVLNYARLTDAFGDIPYTEGGWGQKDILVPKYDTQEFIYKDMLNRLNTSIDVIKTASPERAFPGADPIYENDLDKWVRFANSLRLRYAMRMRFVDAGATEPVVAECLNELLIEENVQNALLECVDTDNGSLYNPWSGSWSYWQFKVSEKLVEWLRGTNDPRLPVFVKPNNDGEFVGIPNGLGDENFSDWDKANTSIPGDVLIARGTPIYELTAAEVYFLRAEAALFNLGPGDANLLYREGIRKSMEQWGIDVTEIENFLANEPEATLSGTEEQQFEQIGNQMWLALIENFAESYSYIRRTGYPVIPKRMAPDYALGDTDGILPTRLKYPLEEEANNTDNVQDVINRQGPNDISTKIWWDVRD